MDGRERRRPRRNRLDFRRRDDTVTIRNGTYAEKPSKTKALTTQDPQIHNMKAVI